MMEIAVTSSSPLGQYLAELEADGGESMAHLLSGPRSATSRKRPIRGTEREARAWGWMQLVQSLQRRVELVAVRRLLPELCVFHPTIREELQQALSDVVAFEMLSEARGGWWTRYIAVVGVLSGVQVAVEEVWRVCAGAGGTMVVVIVAVAAGCESGGVFVLNTMEWVVAIAVFALLGMELSVRLLFAWYAHRSGRLVGSLNGFLVALETFNQTYTGSLTLVKRAELASRGYRLGAGLLPPIGRLEASSKESGSSDEGAAVSAAKSRLRCLPLRRKLRALNDQLQMRAFAFVQEGEQTMNTRIQNPAGEDDILDEQAPSLLLTALAKQRNRAVLLLENAVNAALVRSMARACSSRDNKVGCSLIHTLGSHRVAVDQLIKALSVWITDLEAWNTTKDPVALLTSDSTKRQHQHQQLTPSGPDDPHLKSAATQLQDVRSMAETLTALAIAAQYELLSADSAAESLCSSRDAMRSMIEQLQEAWGNYDNALNTLNGGENPQDTGADEEAEAEDCESKPTEVVAPSSAVAPEDPNCTFVFTGTSTGDDSFDLLALLKQQEADTTAASSGLATFYPPVRDRVTPLFVEYNPVLLGVSAAVTFVLLCVLYFQRSRRYVNVLILMWFSAAQAATFVGLGVIFDTHIAFFNCGATFTWVLLMIFLVGVRLKKEEGTYRHLMSPLVAGALSFVAVVCASCILFIIYGTRFVTSGAFGYSLIFQFILLAWFAWDAAWIFQVVAVDEFAYGVIYIYTDIVLSFLFSVAVAGVAVGVRLLLLL
ncbi:hypothetical protein JG688_00007888 [Phytophthora aleatoria]|uniref:Myosin-binding domain-containing protein n=1 Tax=Phytophthora aleatoria TaxID=2496075 RepID=A0A8J5J7G5_9STRA|nr:hypothetical protein JG688_00007888 [Phytophthora aleatoria]